MQFFLSPSGVDPTIVQVSRVETGSKKGKKELWIKAIQRSVHTHDVRALAVTASDRVYSGGKMHPALLKCDTLINKS